MSQTSHYYSHITGDHGILMCLSGASHHDYEILHDNETGDSRGDDGRCGIRSQDTRHYPFHNRGESFDGGGRSGSRSQNSQSPSHNPGEIVKLFFCGNERIRHSYKTRHNYEYNHGGLYILHPRFPQGYITRGV